MKPLKFALVALPLALGLACGDTNDPDPSGSGSGGSSAGPTGSGFSGAGGAPPQQSGGSSGSNGTPGAAGAGLGGSSGVAGSTGSGSGAPTPEDVCQRGCAKTEALNCPNDPPDCESACLADYLDYPAACRALVLAYGDCAADRPASDFLCDDEGEGVPNDGICEAESLAAAQCLLAQTPI